MIVLHMCRVPRDQFFQFGWRPRAPSLLSKEQDAEIAKHLKDYSKRYDEIDSKLLQEVCCCLPRFCPSTVSPIPEQCKISIVVVYLSQCCSKIADPSAACLPGSLWL